MGKTGRRQHQLPVAPRGVRLMVRASTGGSAWAFLHIIVFRSCTGSASRSHKQQMIILDVSGLTVIWHLRTTMGLPKAPFWAPLSKLLLPSVTKNFTWLSETNRWRALCACQKWFSLCVFMSMGFPTHPFPTITDNQELTWDWEKYCCLIDQETEAQRRQASLPGTSPALNPACASIGTAAVLMLLEIALWWYWL